MGRKDGCISEDTVEEGAGDMRMGKRRGKRRKVQDDIDSELGALGDARKATEMACISVDRERLALERERMKPEKRDSAKERKLRSEERKARDKLEPEHFRFMIAKFAPHK